MNSKQSLKLVAKLIQAENTTFPFMLMSHISKRKLEKLVLSITLSLFKLKKIVPANLLKSPIHKIKVLQTSHSVNTVINIAKVFYEYRYSDIYFITMVMIPRV